MRTEQFLNSVSILKWGNSQGVRLTTDVLRRAHMKVSEEVIVRSELGRIVIEPARKRVNLANLLAQIPGGQGLQLVDYGAPVGRELP